MIITIDNTTVTREIVDAPFSMVKNEVYAENIQMKHNESYHDHSMFVDQHKN